MLAIIIHNIYSSVKLMEAVDVYLEFPEVDILVVSKATSSAAQSGVPEAEKKAYIRGRRILYIPDLKDVLELLKLDRLYLVVPNRLSKNFIDFDRVREEISKYRVGIAFSGGDTTFSKNELGLGDVVTLGFRDILPPVSLISIVLYSLFPKNMGNSN